MIFSIFSQNQKDDFDFLDKIDNLKKNKTLEKQKKKSFSIKKDKSVQIKKNVKVRNNKSNRMQSGAKKPIQKSSSYWIEENINFKPSFQQFGFQVVSNRKEVYQKKKSVPDPVPVEEMTITNLLKTKGSEFKGNFDLKNVLNVIIEYKKIIVILVLIILFAFLRNKYIMKSSKSIMISKKTVISNLNKRKY